MGHFYYHKDASSARAASYSSSGRSTSDVLFAANGGAIEGWTVLSEDEWDYVISNHIGKNLVSINGKNCAVLVPDGVAASVVESSYTAAAWIQAEAQFGLVALPFAGYRSDTSYFQGGSYGRCWSGTPHWGEAAYAYYLYFNSNQAYTNDDFRTYGQSVRLVKEL